MLILITSKHRNSYISQFFSSEMHQIIRLYKFYACIKHQSSFSDRIYWISVFSPNPFSHTEVLLVGYILHWTLLNCYWSISEWIWTESTYPVKIIKHSIWWLGLTNTTDCNISRQWVGHSAALPPFTPSEILRHPFSWDIFWLKGLSYD